MAIKLRRFENKKVRLLRQNFCLVILVFYLIGCGSKKLQTFNLPEPSNTFSKKIEYQEKRTYNLDGELFVDNTFDGARMNSVNQLNDSTFQVTILPENEPINDSPYYSFRIWSKKNRNIQVQLNYPTSEHRYWPKLSVDGKRWRPIDSSSFKLIDDGKNALLSLKTSGEKLWVSAQEIQTSNDAIAWSKAIAHHKDVNFKTIGKSTLGRDMIALDVFNGDPKNKDIIVILSRQHPPEISGYLAAQYFVEELLSEYRLSKDFRKKYRVLIFPMLNPDGVDLGHWRHNAGGIDLNRDWAFYRQDEVNNVVHYIVDSANEFKSKVLLGLDFHSTQEDLYYSFTDDIHSSIYPFKDYWISAIDNAIPHYTPNDESYPIGSPISKAWFYMQFKAESVTYEIGDETPRDFIELKAKVAAREMMKLLILK